MIWIYLIFKSYVYKLKKLGQFLKLWWEWCNEFNKELCKSFHENVKG
jgi:hypothetical protein